jgi:non-heme chloroperoxidase
MPKVVTNDGVALNYVERGEGRPLLIVPGWGMSVRWFQGQLEDLSDRMRVIAFDPRGQGDSDKVSRGQRMARLARDIEDVILGLELEDVVLVGWSLGVSSVLAYIDVFGTDRLAKVVLVDGGTKLINDGDWDLGFVDLEGAAAWRSLVESDLDTAARQVVPQFFAQPPSDEDFDWMVQETVKCDQAGLGRITWNVLNQDYRDVPEKLDVPTLVVAGSHDVVIPAANAPWMAERIPGARLVMFEHSSHCPFLEEREAFNGEVASFVGSPSGDSAPTP